MKWRFDDIVTFLQVVEAGSITAAAERLGMSKSVISKRISDLESAVDVELFRRSTRHVIPTDRGMAFYEKMRTLVHELEGAVEQVSMRDGELRGRLRITAPMTSGTMHLGPVLAGFAREKGLPATIDELSAHACIDYANVHANRLWQFEPAELGGPPRSALTHSRLVANNGEAMRDMALAGLGLVILPLFLVAEQLRNGTLLNALPGATPLPDSIYAIYPPSRHVSRRVRALIDHLIVAFSETPPW